MCMLCVIPPHATPSREKLENSALNNPDGFGFAIVIPSENRIHVEKTMNADTSINRFLEMRKRYPEGYATWHARMATHGTVNVENCHPFQVGDSHTYLAHNGILPCEIATGDTRSDTRVFAEDFLAKIGGAHMLDNPQVFNVIEDFTVGSKVVVLTLDPRAKQQMYLFHHEKGNIDSDNVWWSNDSHTLSSWSSRYTSKHSYGWWDDYDNEVKQEAVYVGGSHEDYTCISCQSKIDYEQMEFDEWVCFFCRTCQMCDSSESACLCYRPGTGKTQYADLSEVPQAILDKVKESAGRYEASFNFMTNVWELCEIDTGRVVPMPKHNYSHGNYELDNTTGTWKEVEQNV